MPKTDRYLKGDRFQFSRDAANKAFKREVAPGNVFDYDGYTVQCKDFHGDKITVEVLQDITTTENTFRLRRLTQLARLSFMESNGMDPTVPFPDDKKAAMDEFLKAHVPEDPETVELMLTELRPDSLNARLGALMAMKYVAPPESEIHEFPVPMTPNKPAEAPEAGNAEVVPPAEAPDKETPKHHKSHSKH